MFYSVKIEKFSHATNISCLMAYESSIRSRKIENFAGFLEKAIENRRFSWRQNHRF
jgi:hypothetical protein